MYNKRVTYTPFVPVLYFENFPRKMNELRRSAAEQTVQFPVAQFVNILLRKCLKRKPLSSATTG